jgi:hypothetical protein
MHWGPPGKYLLVGQGDLSRISLIFSFISSMDRYLALKTGRTRKHIMRMKMITAAGYIKATKMISSMTQGRTKRAIGAFRKGRKNTVKNSLLHMKPLFPRRISD